MADEGKSKTPRAPNCLKCAHYKVSWDPFLPHACEIFEIKSRLIPSIEVYNTTGGNCPSFKARPARPR
ncbi:MAG: hypothetical protein FWE09_00645 [Treponema sp.]|nr:hypothetical protein [Treponema sp.]